MRQFSLLIVGLLLFGAVACKPTRSARSEQESTVASGQVRQSSDLVEVMAAAGLIIEFNKHLSPSLISYGRPTGCCSNPKEPKYALIGGKFRGETGFFRIEPKNFRYCFVPVFSSNGNPKVAESFLPGDKHSGEVFKFVPVIQSRQFGNYAVNLTYRSRTDPDFESYFSYYSNEGVIGGENDPSKTYLRTPSKGVIVAIEDYDPSEMLTPVLAGASLAVDAYIARLNDSMNESPQSKAAAALEIIEKWRPKFRDKQVLALLKKLETNARILAKR